MTDDFNYDKGRIKQVADQGELREVHGKVLQLAEAGYSHSGIAKILDVSGDTVQNTYFPELQEEFGENVIESKPKSETFERTHQTEDGLNNYDDSENSIESN